MAAQVLQLLDHHLSALAVEAAEALVDDDALDGPVPSACVLADAQRQADGDAELLAAREEGDVDRAFAGGAVERLEVERLLLKTGCG